MPERPTMAQPTTDLLAGRSVAVVVGGRHHLYHAARAYDEVGRFSRLFTHRYYRRPRLLRAIARIGPARVRDNLLRAVAYNEPFLDGRVTLFGDWPRAQWPMRLLGTRWLRVGEHDMRRRVGEAIAANGWAMHGISNQAGEAFTVLRAAGLPCLLEQAIGHPRAEQELTTTERERLREHLGDAKDGGSQPHLVERNEREIAEATHIFAGSEFVRQTLLERGVEADRVSLVPYGVEPPASTPSFARRDANERLRIVFVGGDWVRKGLIHLLQGVARLNTTQVEVHVFGCRPPESLVAPFTSFCTVHGSIARETLLARLGTFHVFSLPSLFEGSSLAVFEAMAAGLPVLVTPNTGSVARDGVDGFVVPIRDPDAIARSVDALLDEPRRQAIARSAFDRVLQFGWDRYRDGLLKATGLLPT